MGWGEKKCCNAGEREGGGGGNQTHRTRTKLYILFIDCSPAKREISINKKNKKGDKGR